MYVAHRERRSGLCDPSVVCSFDADRLEAVEVVETELGAPTVGWDSDGRRLYVFCPASGGSGA